MVKCKTNNHNEITCFKMWFKVLEPFVLSHRGWENIFTWLDPREAKPLMTWNAVAAEHFEPALFDAI